MSDTFELDPYSEWGPITAHADGFSDSDKLRLLADWFDHKDDDAGIPAEDRQVQADLRRIAQQLDGDVGADS